jgi:hypothetical protein
VNGTSNYSSKGQQQKTRQQQPQQQQQQQPAQPQPTSHPHRVSVSSLCQVKEAPLLLVPLKIFKPSAALVDTVQLVLRHVRNLRPESLLPTLNRRKHFAAHLEHSNQQSDR